MAIYMPPIARKKKVPDKYNPDSFRVISIDAEVYHPSFPGNIIRPVYDSDPRPARKLLPNLTIRETRVVPHTTYDFRANNPHPSSCGFLRHNARLLNEPVCTVYTKSTYPEQHLWWPSRTSSAPLMIPPYARDTLYRTDYEFVKEEVPKGSMRHTANPNTEPALGSVPVNFLPSPSGVKRLFKEGISFEHQYDSRSDPNYPIRSKRHGAFVWDQLKPDKAQLLIDYHTSVDKRKAEEAEFKQQQMSPKDDKLSAPLPAQLTDPLTSMPTSQMYPEHTVETQTLSRNDAPQAIATGLTLEVPAQSISSPPVNWPYPADLQKSKTTEYFSYHDDTPQEVASSPQS